MTPQPIDLKEAKSGQHRFFEAMFVGEKVHIDAFENQHNPVLSKRYSTVRSQDYLLEILPNGASKASGLKNWQTASVSSQKKSWLWEMPTTTWK